MRALVEAVRSRRPSVVVVELFPFGRRAFAGEIVAMLDAARSLPGWPALTVSSVRDILVARGGEQAGLRRARVRDWPTQYFDAILVHSDPRFARLEESFRPRTGLRCAGPLHGVRHGCATGRGGDRGDFGRGPACGRLGRRAAASGDRCSTRRSTPSRCCGAPSAFAMRLIAGPFLPEPEWRGLRALTRGVAGLSSVRAVPDLGAELARCAAPRSASAATTPRSRSSRRAFRRSSCPTSRPARTSRSRRAQSPGRARRGPRRSIHRRSWTVRALAEAIADAAW